MKNNLKNITVEDIIENSENLCFHFTNKKNLESILEKGLLPSNTGEISGTTGREQPAVFFSKGFRGTLGTINRFLINISRMPLSEHKEYYEKTFPQIYNEVNSITDEEWLYKVAHECLKNKIYLVLNLNGVFKDEWDMATREEKEKLDYIIDDTNHENGKRQTIRNMHTIIGKTVSPEKISVLSADAISVLIQMYNSYSSRFSEQDVLKTEEWEKTTINTNLIKRVYRI